MTPNEYLAILDKHLPGLQEAWQKPMMLRAYGAPKRTIVQAQQHIDALSAAMNAEIAAAMALDFPDAQHAAKNGSDL